MKKPRFTPITVAVGGEAYAGTWRVEGARLEVASTFGSQSVELDGSAPEVLAPILLAQLIRRSLTRS